MFYSSSVYSDVVQQGNLQVVNVMAGYANGEIYFYVDQTAVNHSNCSNTTSNNKIFMVDPQKSDVNIVLSILLTANTTGKKVEVQVYDDGCNNGYAVIRRIKI